MNVDELVRDVPARAGRRTAAAGPGFADRVLAVRGRRRTRPLASAAAATAAVVAVAVAVPLLGSGKQDDGPRGGRNQDDVVAHPDQSPPRDLISAGGRRAGRVLHLGASQEDQGHAPSTGGVLPSARPEDAASTRRTTKWSCDRRRARHADRRRPGAGPARLADRPARPAHRQGRALDPGRPRRRRASRSRPTAASSSRRRTARTPTCCTGGPTGRRQNAGRRRRPPHRFLRLRRGLREGLLGRGEDQERRRPHGGFLSTPARTSPSADDKPALLGPRTPRATSARISGTSRAKRSPYRRATSICRRTSRPGSHRTASSSPATSPVRGGRPRPAHRLPVTGKQTKVRGQQLLAWVGNRPARRLGHRQNVKNEFHNRLVLVTIGSNKEVPLSGFRQGNDGAAGRWEPVFAQP